MATITATQEVIERVGELVIKRDRWGEFGIYHGREHLTSESTLEEALQNAREIEEEHNHQQLCKAKWAILERVFPKLEDCDDLDKLRAIEAILQAK